MGNDNNLDRVNGGRQNDRGQWREGSWVWGKVEWMVFRGFTRQLHGETLPHTGETFLHINRRPRTRSIVVKHGCIVHTGARTRCGDLETMHSSAAIDFSMGRRIEWTVFSPRKINFFFIQVFLPLRRVYYFAYFIRSWIVTLHGDRRQKWEIFLFDNYSSLIIIY